MKAMLLMLGALSAAIIFVGCGTAVGRATGVDSSEAENVLSDREVKQRIYESCTNEVQMYLQKGGIRSRAQSTFNLCQERMTAELANEGGIDSDVEKAVEAAEQEMEIVKAGAEKVLAEKDVLEIAQRDCQMQAYSFKRQKDGRSPEEFIRDCMTEATANISSSGDIDSDVEKAVEAAEQEMEIVKAGAEEVLAKRDLIALAQARCQQDFYDPSKRKGKPHHIFMNECMRDASGDIDELIDTDIEKAVEAAEQQMAVAKAEADRAEEEREIREAATRLCRHDSLNPSKRKGKSRIDFMNECLREAAANRDASDDIDTDIEKEVDIAEQELEIVKAGAEDVFEERVASLEEKVAELTELLEALQTQ